RDLFRETVEPDGAAESSVARADRRGDVDSQSGAEGAGLPPRRRGGAAVPRLAQDGGARGRGRQAAPHRDPGGSPALPPRLHRVARAYAEPGQGRIDGNRPVGSARPGRPGRGGVAEWFRQGPAKPSTAVRFRSPPRGVLARQRRFPRRRADRVSDSMARKWRGLHVCPFSIVARWALYCGQVDQRILSSTPIGTDEFGVVVVRTHGVTASSRSGPIGWRPDGSSRTARYGRDELTRPQRRRTCGAP